MKGSGSKIATARVFLARHRPSVLCLYANEL